MTEHKHTNRLINETSPYLQQHAHNPVDWYPWGDEALNKAKEEDKPIFLSIGYSACHWCHVMERECFENEEIAALMNKYFINIKVDREERPDLDEIYMSAVQGLTGQGGWPLSVFLTPDLKPFHGGTYFPPQDMYGRPGFPRVLQAIATHYEENRDDINQAASRLAEYVEQVTNIQPGKTEINYDLIQSSYEEMNRRFDEMRGGFGTEPKFPHSMDLSLLLRYYHRTGDENALKMVELTLEKMARGGMYDQIGGGFHRYSTDARWLIPHFEKMLYDNALLAKTYLEAYQLTQKPFYKRIAKETLDYVLREMTSPEGGFYSTQDADSEGKEGKFFIWTPDEIHGVLGDEKGKIVCRYYGVDESGNFEHGTSVLHVSEEPETVAKRFDIDVEELNQIIKEANCKLFAEREKRVKPGRDEKILTDWNGLMISTMAFAGNVLDEPRYAKAAGDACDFLFDKLMDDGRLLHTYKDGKAHTSAFLSDYSSVINGLIDTYETNRNPKRLEQAIHLNKAMIERFWDEGQGGFFVSDDSHETPVARSKSPLDNAVPSGNSIAVLSLLRLSEMTGEIDYRAKAETSLQFFSDLMKQIPAGFAQMMCALDFLLASPKEIVLTAHEQNAIDDFQKALFSRFIPDKVVLYADSQSRDQLEAISPVAKDKKPLDGQTTAYVCQNFTCKEPVLSIDALMDQLEVSPQFHLESLSEK